MNRQKIQVLRPNFRLHSLLVLLAAIAFAPIFIAITYSTFDIQEKELVNEKKELESFANLAVANQKQIIEGERQMLATIASGPSLRRADLALLCTEFLQNVIKAAPSNVAIGLIDLDGKMVCGSDNEFQLTDLRSREFFRKAVDARKFVAIGSILVSNSGKKSIGLGMPVLDYDGQLRGIAFALLDSEYISHQLQSVSLPEALEINIYDANGKTIASTKKAIRELSWNREMKSSRRQSGTAVREIIRPSIIRGRNKFPLLK